MSEDVPDSSEGRLYAAETPGHMTLVIGDKYLTDSWQSFAYLAANLMTFVDFIAAQQGASTAEVERVIREASHRAGLELSRRMS